MRPTTSLLATFALGLPVLGLAGGDKGHGVTSKKLQKHITLDNLLAGSQKLQDFADAHGGNRVFGSGGHNATVDWLYDTLSALGYYDVVKQPFSEIFFEGHSAITVDGAALENTVMTYTPGGSVSAQLVYAPAAGAKAAGAAAVIVYNNVEGSLAGTLGDPFGEYLPIVGISQADGQALIAALEAGEVAVDFELDATVEDRVNFNVIAETKGGDHDNVLILGGHSDSVVAGPGINDDGSGTVGVLNVAVALANFRINNAVRFAFWGAEEYGKLGSYHYVKQLNTSATELAKIRAYLNFDMIASPNYILGIYDGNGDAFNLTGPAGSDVIERDFEDFFDSNGAGHVPTEFSGRSDYAAFIENGIPSGGLFTGAEGVKTEAEAALFGGEAGVAYDINYHQAGDDINNLAHDAYLLNARSIANSVAKYATSFDSLPAVNLAKRGWAAHRARFVKREDGAGHGHSHAHTGPCGGGVPV
ncbi:unnamed protein product [Parascedosporium putredinis]|uniref:Peptide hydrolase n=1 Tax=Parascedosporium putredinis TaxID=1442378 RepID=A0A9P1H169_9PEZI|nr:unnamed protein product [Parascedosporium putredinis]CAI7993387.1 unnamed protein product [Parascedosporium putredinis]